MQRITKRYYSVKDNLFLPKMTCGLMFIYYHDIIKCE